jgi:hypothetical protein
MYGRILNKMQKKAKKEDLNVLVLPSSFVSLSSSFALRVSSALFECLLLEDLNVLVLPSSFVSLSSPFALRVSSALFECLLLVERST